MPVTWKLRALLDERGITPYRLAQETAGSLSMRSVYNLVKADGPARVELATLEVLVRALRSLTGDASINVEDLVTIEEESDA